MMFAVKLDTGWYWTSYNLYPYMFKITSQDWTSEFKIDLGQALMEALKK